jgi:hypothetical protein
MAEMLAGAASHGFDAVGANRQVFGRSDARLAASKPDIRRHGFLTRRNSRKSVGQPVLSKQTGFGTSAM